MQQQQSSNDRSNFDGKELARQLYGPPALSGEARNEGPPTREKVDGRVPFDPHIGFYELRRQCIAAGARYGEPYRSLLLLLKTCEPMQQHESEESRGASYKRLCAAAYMAGFSYRERLNLYWITEQVGMSDRFAGHLIASLKREGRANG